LTTWRSKETEAQKKIEAKRRELEALKVSFDMSYISKLATDEASHDQAVKNLNTWKPHLQDVRKSGGCAEAKMGRTEPSCFPPGSLRRKATNTLREALTDLQVSLKYSESAHSPEAADQIIRVMEWRTNNRFEPTGL